ncbi:hypothetical protein [Intrasporangium sp.]|uniref:hypothetical protein n=1 Tax=Intrasporangium sp. TaxID=1925024 RepID=UPI00293B2E67|nr:hypothetical protein [Intrasporangium sp.]MDV3222885.1 hypothetical protein [Intrasporangium sp.]
MSDSTHPVLARLDRASADLVARVDLAAQLVEAEGLLRQAESQCERLVRRLADEERDVDRLEGVSLRRVVTAVRGSRETDLDRERAEVDTAASALARAESERDAVRGRVDGLRRDLQRLEDAEVAYEQALADVVSAADVSRRAGIDAASGPGPTIDPLTVVRATNLLARRRERREVAEAVAAGHEAMSGLADALSALQSADGWSDWDTFAGGGFISSSIKHDRMDRASGLIERAQAALVAFGRELDDLGLPGIVLPSTDGLTRGVDIWFDNIFTDLGVRGRIKSSLTSVQEVLGQVSEVVQELEARQRELAPRGPLD